MDHSFLLAVLPSRLLAKFVRLMGASIGESTVFKGGLVIDNASGDRDSTGDYRNLIVGKDCYVGRGVFFDLPDRIEIGDGTAISARAVFMTHADCNDRPMSRWYPRQRGPIKVGKGSWIGVGATILHGVTLGDYCVVGAGAVVRDSFPDRSVVAGVPAKLVKRLPETEDLGA
jgi:acetyltransferase-like isoleucine patch superfamily enzyme